MGYNDGKLLYRGWLSAQADNGPLLYASSPTGNGELVCAKEYQYYFNGTSPSYNMPYYRSNYDRTGYQWYNSAFDGETMFQTSSLLSVEMDKDYPSMGNIPIASTATPGILREGAIWYNQPDYEDVWDAVVIPFLIQATYQHHIDVDTGKKLFVFAPHFEIFTFQYPSQKDIDEGVEPPRDPQTGNIVSFHQVVEVLRNWDYDDWSSGNVWGDFIDLDERAAVCWNWRKKGYGTMIPMNTATLNWVINQHLMGATIANYTLLQTPGTYEIFIAK